jgi:site-specific DNA-methyltransferase (adenine-specific)
MPLPLNTITCGDCFELIRKIPNNSINLVITSPPYFQQRDYGGGIGNENTIEEYLEALLAIMRECARVITDDGSIVFNMGDKYDESSLLLVPYRFAIEASQLPHVKLVNVITWVKSNPTPRQFKRRLVSSTEPFFHFVKSENYFYNLDNFMAVEHPRKNGSSATSKMGKHYFDLIETSDLSAEQKRMAREELSKVIQEVKTGKIEGFRMKIRGIHSEPFGGQAGGRQIQLTKNGFTIIRIHGNPLKKDVIEMPVESVKGNTHPAMYPVKLVVEFLNLLTRENDVVLDPFMGSGSTAVACKLTGRHYIGFDLNPDYCRFAEERLQNTVHLPSLLL